MSKPFNNVKVTQQIIVESDYLSTVPNYRAAPRVNCISCIDGRKNRETIGTRVYALEIIETISVGRTNIHIHLVIFHSCSNLLLALNKKVLLYSQIFQNMLAFPGKGLSCLSNPVRLFNLFFFVLGKAD